MDAEFKNFSSLTAMSFASSNTSTNALLGLNEDTLSINATFQDTRNLSDGSFILEDTDSLTEQDPELKYIGFGIPNTALANRIVHYCFGILLIVIGVAGAIGNGLVIYVFTRYRRLRGGGVPLILSLAAGDFSVSIFHIMPAYSSFMETWSFGNLGCEIYAAAVGLCGLASLLTLSVIAAERFSVILGSPVTWLSSKKVCALIWIFGLVLVFPPFVGWSKFVVEGIGTSCSWDYTSRDYRNRLYYIFLLTFGFVIPVSVIIISYVGILQIFCKQSYRMHGISRNGGLSKKHPTRSEVRTVQVVLSIITCFLVSWTPYAICSMIGQFGDASLLSPLATALPALFAKSSVIYNPFVYGLSHPLFRTAFAALKAQYMGKRNNSSGIYLNPRYPYNNPHVRPYHHNQHTTTSGITGRNRKTQMVVTAKGNNSFKNRPYNRNGYHLDGQKMQFDGFKGKIPTHLLRHFTGGGNNSDNAANSSKGRCDMGDDNMGHHQSSQRFKGSTNEQEATTSSFSAMTTPNTSFRCRQSVHFLKKGAWISKRKYRPSESETTIRTAVLTHNEASISSGVSDDAATSPKGKKVNRSKSTLKCENQKKNNGFMKNSYSFFLCEYRKRRQQLIQQKFFRSENCLVHRSCSRQNEGTSSKSNIPEVLSKTQHQSALTIAKTTSFNDVYYSNGNRAQFSWGKKSAEVGESLLLHVAGNKSDTNDETDDLPLGGGVDTLHDDDDHQEHSIENKDDSLKIEPSSFDKVSSPLCSNELNSYHNGKHLNFIKMGKCNIDGISSIYLPSKCPDIQQSSKRNTFHFENVDRIENEELLSSKIWPRYASLRTRPQRSCDEERKKIRLVKEASESNKSTKGKDFQHVKKSVSMSGVFTTEPIIPSSTIIRPKKRKTVLVSGSECDLVKIDRDEVDVKVGRCNSSSFTLVKHSVSSIQTFEFDSSGNILRDSNNPDTVTPSSYQPFSKEDDDGEGSDSSQCNSASESCYASCKSDLYCSQSLDDMEREEYYCV